MRVLQLTLSLVRYDAVGNDIECMHELMSRYASCYVFAMAVDRRGFKSVTDEKAVEICRDPEALVIYHHSTHFDGIDRFLRGIKAKLIIRYHNITPAHFFRGYSMQLCHSGNEGREQTVRLARVYKSALWLCDSRYNTTDISDYVEAERIAILPPMSRIGEWADKAPDAAALSRLKNNGAINALFVGRIVPNKGFEFLMDIVKCFKDNYEKKLVLHIIGKPHHLAMDYYERLKKYIRLLGLGDCVRFVGESNDNTLIAYYTGCDVFLCASEHEGFCVPIAEAQYFNLPVVARDTSAVGDTLGEGQALLAEDVREYAAAIDLIAGDPAASAELKTNGHLNAISRFDIEVLNRGFLDVLTGRLGIDLSPDAGHDPNAAQASTDSCRGVDSLAIMEAIRAGQAKRYELAYAGDLDSVFRTIEYLQATPAQRMGERRERLDAIVKDVYKSVKVYDEKPIGGGVKGRLKSTGFKLTRWYVRPGMQGQQAFNLELTKAIAGLQERAKAQQRAIMKLRKRK